jgi:hypothetical protein
MLRFLPKRGAAVLQRVAFGNPHGPKVRGNPMVVRGMIGACGAVQRGVEPSRGALDFLRGGIRHYAVHSGHFGFVPAGILALYAPRDQVACGPSE